MIISDWVGGLALAAFLGLPCGVMVALYASLADKPAKFDFNASLISPTDIRRSLISSALFMLVFTPLGAMLFKNDRQDAQSWQTYIRDHKCVAVDSRTHTEWRSGGYPGTSHSETITEYLWRCEGGDEHWHH